MGAPIDEAKALYNKGEYAAALQRLQQLVKKSPRDGSSNYWLGATLVAMGRNAEAIAPLEKADDRGVAEAALLLARIARDEYRPDEARDYYDSYEERLAKEKIWSCRYRGRTPPHSSHGKHDEPRGEDCRD